MSRVLIEFRKNVNSKISSQTGKAGKEDLLSFMPLHSRNGSMKSNGSPIFVSSVMWKSARVNGRHERRFQRRRLIGMDEVRSEFR
jgi:hypothetical protein